MSKKRNRIKIFIFTAFAILLAVIYQLPVMIAILNSFKTKGEILTSAISFPVKITLQNYIEVISASNFVGAFFNSFLVTGGGILLNLIISLPCGYALSRWKSKAVNLFNYIFLSSMFVPFHTIMIALLITAKNMHLTGSVGGLILVYGGLQCSIPILLIKVFVSSLPYELEEAAIIDGCSIFQRFYRVVVPLLKPITATVAILNALWIWNDFLLPYLMLGKPITIPLSQMYFYGQYNQQWHLIMAGFVVSAIPITIFFLIMQKNVIHGITAGAVKG